LAFIDDVDEVGGAREGDGQAGEALANAVIQGLLTPLNRSCSSADVVDNLTGLAAGFALGSAAGWLWGRLSRTGE
jgi:hypothetical protein